MDKKDAVIYAESIEESSSINMKQSSEISRESDLPREKPPLTKS